MTGHGQDPPTKPPSDNIVNPLHLHIDCTQGISARSLLDGLRALARSSGDTHSRDAFQMDPMSANIWKQHIPADDRSVLKDGGSRAVNKESPVMSWEPYRKAIRDTPEQVSDRVVWQLKELLDALELYYDDDVKQVSPLYPSVVWHMKAVILLLDRLRIQSISCSAVPKHYASSGVENPAVLAMVLEDFEPTTTTTSSENDNAAITTFDGAILLKVLQPRSPVPHTDLVFHGMATGKDAQIKTELGLTFDQTLRAAPPEMAPVASKAVDPAVHDQAQAVGAAAAVPPNAEQQQDGQAQPSAVPPPNQAPKAAAAGANAAAAAPVQQQAADEQQRAGTPGQQNPRAIASVAPPPQRQHQTRGALESPLWNVEKTLTLLQTNIDDMTAEHLSFCTELLFQVGAVDVWLTPIVMKKGRAAQELNCLAHDDLTQALLVTIFRQTTSIGVRVWSPTAGLQRVSLRREMVKVEYCRKPIDVKVAYLGAEPVSLKPEYDQCAALAEEMKIPVVVVTEEAKAMAKDAVLKKLYPAAGDKRYLSSPRIEGFTAGLQQPQS